MRILYVEDNPANLFLVQRVARMGNHEVLNYTSGETALENFERDHPDLVLMDVQLAGNMTGLDVVRKLRGSGYHTPIIAVTAYAMIGDRERCIDAGCDDYLAKPLPVPKLVEIIKRYDPQQQAQVAEVMLQVTQPSRPTSEMPVVPVSSAQPPAPSAASSNHNASVSPVVTAAPAAPAATPPPAAPIAPAPVTAPAAVEMPVAEVKSAEAAVPAVPDAKPAGAGTAAPDVQPAVEVKPAAEAKPAENSAAPAPVASSTPQPSSASVPELSLLDDEPDSDPDAKTEPYKPIHIELDKEDKV